MWAKCRLVNEIKNRKQLTNNYLRFSFAEREGFEPPIPHGTPVFKTGAFNRSAISPDDAKLALISLLASELSKNIKINFKTTFCYSY